MRIATALCLLAAISGAVGCAAIPANRPIAEAVTPLDHLPALRGDYFRFDSVETGRPYHIYVRYPEGYDPSAARLYPTVYLTDGDSLFPILAANHLFLTYDDRLPEAIVVGIAYGGFDPSVNRRNIDFATVPHNGSPAGAPAFQAFLKTELLPEIERRYRSDPAQRVLFGQSLGGAFVLYSAVSDPDLFRGRIASNPSLIVGMEPLLESAAASRTDLGLVVVSGTRDRPDRLEAIGRWQAAWEPRTDKPWRLDIYSLEGGTHAANAPDAYRLGMNRLFGPDASP
ncbi:alpha/beta hydrolase [Brevundimonas lenta]|uniref:Esterase n=1 Tax=Brevundimonas lenta TaxID=424796 RepID=A0A7W6JF93_9CAUL|nr:alpha/beta hydrolase-fold protein [Brevundimonas lenta]MBB4083056.1 hypothetical protein [Brevundimonas lenta]